MTTALKVLFLGIVEGLTEFLPISSTGHLIVASALLDFQHSANGTFEIFIQLGAVIAVIAFYRADLLRQVKNVRTDASIQRLWLSILVAFFPAGLIGFLLKDWVKTTLFSPIVVGLSLIAGGIVFLAIERRLHQPSEEETKDLTDISLRQALGVGLAQVVALIPGVSRSGASIIGGLLGGLSREVATQFSFYLAIPTLGIATIFDLLTNVNQLSDKEVVSLIAGMIVSGIVAWLSMGWLLRYVARNTFITFGYYRILAGALILLLAAASVL